jgi:MFS family permease
MTDRGAATAAGQGSRLVLITLASGQFLMTLDSSVMNVAIATVAKDVGTTVTGIQTAITLYTLVMAMLMIPGGKVGSLIGRRRAFSIGCVIYGAGSLTTALAQNLTVLIVGWSILEGIGAALILPAIVALVAGNFAPEGRPRAYGLVMAAGAIAVALGPLIGGIATTYFSWRYVFVGEVLIVLVILALARRIQDAPAGTRPRLDLVGAVLSAAGLGLAVFGVLRSSVWGWVLPKPGGPAILGLSPTIVLIFAGLFVLWLFSAWEHHVEKRGAEPLVRLSMLGNRQLSGGLVMFFFQFLIQAGLFFTIPLYLSVALGLSAIDTGLKIIPLSVTLLIAAAGIPRFFPRVSPRLVVQAGLLAMFGGIVWLFVSIDVNAGAEIVTVPLLLAGVGIGALASQLGSVTVSAPSWRSSRCSSPPGYLPSSQAPPRPGPDRHLILITAQAPELGGWRLGTFGPGPLAGPGPTLRSRASRGGPAGLLVSVGPTGGRDDQNGRYLGRGCSRHRQREDPAAGGPPDAGTRGSSASGVRRRRPVPGDHHPGHGGRQYCGGQRPEDRDRGRGRLHAPVLSHTNSVRSGTVAGTHRGRGRRAAPPGPWPGDATWLGERTGGPGRWETA